MEWFYPKNCKIWKLGKIYVFQKPNRKLYSLVGILNVLNFNKMLNKILNINLNVIHTTIM